MGPKANRPCTAFISAGVNCLGTMRSTCSEQEFNRARMIVRCCDRCGKVQSENLPVRSSKPSEKYRGKLRARAQKIGADVQSGKLKFDRGYWHPVAPSKQKADQLPEVRTEPADMGDHRFSPLPESPVLPVEVIEFGQPFTPRFDHEGE
jgi:hypothetical protein